MIVSTQSHFKSIISLVFLTSQSILGSDLSLGMYPITRLILEPKVTLVALLNYRTLKSGVKIESAKIKSVKKQVWLKMLKIA